MAEEERLRTAEGAPVEEGNTREKEVFPHVWESLRTILAAAADEPSDSKPQTPGSGSATSGWTELTPDGDRRTKAQYRHHDLEVQLELEAKDNLIKELRKER